MLNGVLQLELIRLARDQGLDPGMCSAAGVLTVGVCFSQRHQFIMLFIDGGSFIQMTFDIGQWIPRFISKIDGLEWLPPLAGTYNSTGGLFNLHVVHITQLQHPRSNVLRNWSGLFIGLIGSHFAVPHELIT